MTTSLDRLYDLLPVAYRMRDYDQGQPLRALLQVIAEQVNVVEDDITQLYENWFIETCQEWAVPYIADLIGYRLVHEAGEPGAVTTVEGRARNAILMPRREVANTIRYRRRKGALALLELLANDVAGWPVRAVEFYRLLGLFQHINHLHLRRGRTVDLRHGDALDLINGPFEHLAHTVDVRRLNSHRTPGRYNIPSVGLFVWRLRAYSITRAPAYCVDRVRNQYTFSILGNDTPLFTLPVAEPQPTHIADEMNVPAPVRRRAFQDRTADYYGPGKSLCIWRDSPDGPHVRIDQIVPADLSDWAYRPIGEQIAVDPELGRIAFSPRTLPKTGVWVSYHYGFSADMGGGEYERALRQPGDRKLYRVGPHADYARINDALAQWRQDAPADAMIEITDSGAYVEQIEIVLQASQHLELRAAEGTRPVIRLLDFYTNRPDAMRIEGPDSQPEDTRGARVILDGLLIAGRSVQINGSLAEVLIRHCTLVPGWSLQPNCEPENETEPSLELIDTTAQLIIEHSIVGSIQINQNEVKTDPLPITISDSIIDATRREYEAIGAPGYPVAHALLTILRSTVFGRVQVHAIDLAENSIFDGQIKVARRQHGCVRFCYVPPGSRTPRRYNCQPDLVEQTLKTTDEYLTATPPVQQTLLQRERQRVRPQFNSVRYGTPTYAQLALTCTDEIKQGADDEAEMGAFHDLFQPQREANLRARLDEYAPAGMDASIIFVT